MAMSSVSKFSNGKEETDIRDLRIELFALQKTRETLIKFLEAVRCVKNDLNTMTTNYIQLKQINEQWVTLLVEMGRTQEKMNH